VCVWEKAENVK